MKIMLQLSKHQNKYIDLCSTDNATSKEKHRRCASPLLHISYLEHTTNDWVQSKINFLVDPQEPLLATIKRRKLAWFEHNTCHDSLSKPIFQGTLEGRRHRGRQRKSWMDKIKEWTSLPMPELLKRASCKKKTGKGSLLNRPSSPPDDPNGHGTELPRETQRSCQDETKFIESDSLITLYHSPMFDEDRKKMMVNELGRQKSERPISQQQASKTCRDSDLLQEYRLIS